VMRLGGGILGGRELEKKKIDHPRAFFVGLSEKKETSRERERQKSCAEKTSRKLHGLIEVCAVTKRVKRMNRSGTGGRRSFLDKDIRI